MKTQLDKHLFLASHAQAQLFSHKYKTKKPSPVMRYVVIAVLLLMVFSSRGQDKVTLEYSKPMFPHIDTTKFRADPAFSGRYYVVGSPKYTLFTQPSEYKTIFRCNLDDLGFIKSTTPKTLELTHQFFMQPVDTVIIGNRIYTLKKD